jgi:hypothetical protein
MWLQSVERVHGRLQGRLVSVDGAIEWIDIQSVWQHKLPIPLRTRASAVTNLHEWKVADTAEYLSLAGLDAGMAGGHTTYAFNYEGLRFLVPSILVLKALFRPNATVFEYLYRPSALDLLLAPVSDADTMTVRVLPRRMRQHVPLGATSFSRLQWLYCFPSAREAWDSVYGNAVRGKIEVATPRICANVAMKGMLSSGTVLVSSLTFNSFEPAESPFTWAGEQPRQFDFSTDVGAPLPFPTLKKEAIVQGPNGWELSDDEWSSIEHLFPTGSKLHSGARARSLVSAILTKLGSGSGWKTANASLGTTAGVSSFYQNCTKSGRWHAVERILIHLRQKA